jgi:hypothetical protein
MPARALPHVDGNSGIMKWLALTFGGAVCASAQFRVRQYVPLLRDMGIELVCRQASELHQAGDLRAFDGILLQKKLISWPLRRQIARSGVPMIFDTDDATWHPHSRKHHLFTRWRTRHRLRAVTKLSRRVLAANAYLVGQLRPLHAHVEVFPMTLPLAEWKPATPPPGPVVLGWAGDPRNHFHLLHIADALREIKRVHPEVIMRIFSGTRPALDMDFDFVPFQADRQIEALHSFSVGLLPMPDTSFNHGKSPIKALHYMASGIPCVASALSGTKEMLGEGECGFYAADNATWTQHLLTLIRDHQLRCRLGEQARKRYEDLFTTEAAAVRLAAILRQTAGQHREAAASA